MRDHRNKVFIALTLWLIPLAVLGQLGCSMEKSLVCGDDGVVYQNACIAQSQGVKVVSQGNACHNGKKSAQTSAATQLATANLNTDGSATSYDLTHFAGEGYKFIGKVNFASTSFRVPTVDPASKPSASYMGTIFATRITPTGHLYIKREDAVDKGSKDASAHSPPHRPANNTLAPSSRRLLVWGADGRVQVTKATYPYSAVGQFEGLTAQDGGYSCSGALVEEAAIFTAGHCVYDASANAWSNALDFYPERLSQNDKTAFSWLWATTWWGNAHGICGPETCSTLEAYKYDFAVVRLALPIGQLVGWLGLKYDLKKQGYSVTSAGYPGDKAYGTMWKTTGKLAPFSGADSGLKDYTNGVVPSDLDAYPGQSGSNVWDKDYYTRALVNAGTSDGRVYHRTVTRTVYNLVMANIKGVNLFEKTKYRGGAISVMPGNYASMGTYDNWVSSLSISPGCTVTLYEFKNFGGRKLALTADSPSLGTFDNLASSLKLVCKI